jgi:hypothetical protein
VVEDGEKLLVGYGAAEAVLPQQLLDNQIWSGQTKGQTFRTGESFFRLRVKRESGSVSSNR